MGRQKLLAANWGSASAAAHADWNAGFETGTTSFLPGLFVIYRLRKATLPWRPWNAAQYGRHKWTTCVYWAELLITQWPALCVCRFFPVTTESMGS